MLVRDRSCVVLAFFLSVLRRFQMVRKGWTQVEVPGGWLQLIRGARPKRSSVEACQRTGQNGVSPGRAPVLEVTFEAARVRVQKMEAALLAMADFPRPEVDVLQAVLTRAKAAAVPPPLNVQVIRCQMFIERVREAETRRLQEGRQRLQRLQQEAVAGALTVSDRPAAPDVASEVVRLQDHVAHFQAQLAKASEGVPATVVCPADRVQESPSKKGRVRASVPEFFH